MILNVFGDFLAGTGAGVLAYRAYMTYVSEYGFRAPEMAALASERTTADVDVYAQAFSIAEVFDFDRGRALVTRQANAWIGMALIVLGAVFPLVGLVVREGPVAPGGITAGFGAGVVLAWILARVFRLIWNAFKEEAVLGHAWLAWLERQVSDPLGSSVNPSQDIVYVALASPPPGLSALLKHSEPFVPLTAQDREASEQWIADFAMRRKHQFRTVEWREWMKRRRRPRS